MRDTNFKYSGEPTVKSLAGGLATLGRYGDDYMVHAAEGETFVPKEIFEANPELKESLFKQMTMMGIENPNRYVVGDAMNSINPITGQPEFFFKKIGRFFKKVAKKILPIAAPIIGNLIAPGIGGILASGLVTKLTGGSAADAFKSMALSYGIGAIGRGVQGGFSTTGTGFFPDTIDFNASNFGKGLSEGLRAPFSAFGNLASSGPNNPLAQGIFGPRSDFAIPGVFSGLSNSDFAKQPFGGGTGIMSKVFPSYQASTMVNAPFNKLGAAPLPSGAGYNAPGGITTSNAQSNLSDFGDFTGDVSLSDPSLGLLDAGQYPIGTTVTKAGKDYLVTSSLDKTGTSFRNIFEEIKPEGILSNLSRRTGEFLGSPLNLTGTPAKVLGATALGAGALFAADAAGVLTPEELTVAEMLEKVGKANPRRAAYDKWQGLPDKNSPEAQSLKSTWYGTPSYSTAQLSNLFKSNPIQGITVGTPGAPPGAPIVAAAGGEIMGPGTGTSDSIPARLSDGEFVMTARAVRNAGNGNRDLGAARMYDMMNRFESGAA